VRRKNIVKQNAFGDIYRKIGSNLSEKF